MSLHRLAAVLLSAHLPEAGKALLIPSAGKHLIAWGSDDPTSETNAMVYFKLTGMTLRLFLHDGGTQWHSDMWDAL